MSCLLVVLAYSSGQQAASENKYTDIRTIRFLKFYKGQRTESMSGNVIQQMRPTHTLYTPDWIECENIKRGKATPQWSCKASEKDVELVEYTIECEGQRGDDDYNVLDQSCSVIYSVRLPKAQRYESYNREPEYIKYQTYYDTYSRYYDNGVFNSRTPQHPVDLRDINVLVFDRGMKTTSRRGETYPQLVPKQGNLETLDQVICRSLGFDGTTVKWKCRSPITAPRVFQEAHVSCEGWNGPGDFQIVPGSCNLEYKVGYVHTSSGSFGDLLIGLGVIVALILLCALCAGGVKQTQNPNVVHHFHHGIPNPMNAVNARKDEEEAKKEKRETVIADTTTR